MLYSIKIRTGISTYRLQKRSSVSSFDNVGRSHKEGPKEIEYSEAKQIIELHFYNEGSLALRNFVSNNYLDQEYRNLSNNEVLHQIIKELGSFGNLALYKEEEKITIDPIEITEKNEPIQEETTESLKIQLFDHEGEPVSGESYLVIFSDGSQKSGSLDKKGEALLKGVKPGTARIQFPDLHPDDWTRGMPS